MNAIVKYFNLDKLGTTVRREILAGLTAYMTMSYILAVNPIVLAKAGIPVEGSFLATALASAVACLMMGLYAKLPIGLGPSMALNAFFVYTVVLGMGYAWQTALTAVFLEGIIFLLLSIFKVRDIIVRSIPMCLKYGLGAGIGLFITYIGLTEGKLIGDNPATLTGLVIHFSQDKGSLLTIIGLVITGALVVRNVNGALLIGMVLTTLIGFPLGVTHFNYHPFSLENAFSASFQLQLDVKDWAEMGFIVFSFLCVDLFDTSGTVAAIALRAGLVDDKGNIINSRQAMMSDSVGTIVGSLLGTSTVTSYIESVVGIEAGGRSGLMAVVVGILFLCSIILAPFFLMVPEEATAPVLILLGMYMLKPIFEMDRNNYVEYITVFITLILTPFSFSIFTGLMFGLFTYIVLKVSKGEYKDIPGFTYFIGLIFLIKAVGDFA